MIEKKTKDHYENLDGFRAISSLCIVAYHLNKYSKFQLSGVGSAIVESWTWFVPLFLILSGFGMFCGYYDRIREQKIDLNSFFLKRYKKILPFFLCIIVADLIMDRSMWHLVEGFTEATLVFGLLPNNSMNVAGVAWTLGVIFLFYMLFPYAVFLCWTKRRAWFSFAASVVLSLSCEWYFCTDLFVTNFTKRHAFLYCAPFFMLGGVIYLYRGQISKIVSSNKGICLSICILLSVLFYVVPEYILEYRIIVIKALILFAAWVSYAISVKSFLLSSGIAKFLSNISLEIYLGQMIAYRLYEKVCGLYLFGKGWLSFFVDWVAIISILVVGITLWKLVYGRIENALCKRSDK